MTYFFYIIFGCFVFLVIAFLKSSVLTLELELKAESENLRRVNRLANHRRERCIIYGEFIQSIIKDGTTAQKEAAKKVLERAGMSK